MVVSNQDTLDKEALVKLARESHYALRQHLIQLKENPPSEATQLEQLNQETARLMRELYDQHLAIYMAQGKVVIPENLSSVNEFINWRIGQVEMEGDDSLDLMRKDVDRWHQLFDPSLYGGDAYLNHWHIALARKIGTRIIWGDLGDIHTDLSYAHVISSYLKDFTTAVYFGSEMTAGDLTLTGGLTDWLPEQPRGKGYGAQQPLVVTEPDGNITLSL